MGLQDHKELRIVRGVYKTPGDTRSGENNITAIDLLSPAGGIGLQSWSPNLAALETGGVWTDSPLQVGRTPLVLNEGNVIETMRITINGGSPLGTMKKYSEFLTLMLNARQFWTDNAQIDPVYLHWFSACGAGKQYALIYNMEFKPEYNDSPAAIITGSLTIEREPYWRFIPPGGNPKQWYYEFHNQLYDTSGADIALQLDQLVASTFNNKSEFNDALNLQLLTDNAITIPANYIPGDAPALVLMDFGTAAATAPFVMVGKKTAKVPTYNATNAIAQNGIMNAADGTLGTDATKVNDTGASKAAGSGTAQRVRVTFATATDQLRLTFLTLGKNRFVGRYMAFLRCRQINGAVGDITMYLRYGQLITTSSDGVKLNVVSPQLIAGTGNTTSWGLTYMGVMNFPIDGRKVEVNSNSSITSGYGITTSNLDIYIGLFASKVGGTQELYINDLVLIPIDEGSIALESTGTTPASGMQFDNTGYYSHGLTDPIAINCSQVGTVSAQDAKLTGTGIVLTPGVENKLYCLTYDGSVQSRADLNFLYSVNIIPRCRGIRTYSNLAGASASG